MSSNGGIRGAINTPTASAASGRWSVREMFLSVKGGVWPSVTVPFSPPSLNPVLWLDASDTSTITESGGAVSQWNNKGSLGNFTQATGAVQPTTGATTLNGLNVIDFAADYMTADDTNEWKFLHDGTKWIAAMVAKFATSANPGSLLTIMSSNAGASGNVGVYVAYRDDSPLNDAFRMTVTRGVAASFVVTVFNDDVLPAATPLVMSLLADPSNGTAADRLKVYKDAGSATATNAASNAVSTANPTDALRLGALGAGTEPLTGYIAEMVIVSGANATETNRAALRDYLNDKWAVY